MTRKLEFVDTLQRLRDHTRELLGTLRSRTRELPGPHVTRILAALLTAVNVAVQTAKTPEELDDLRAAMNDITLEIVTRAQ